MKILIVTPFPLAKSSSGMYTDEISYYFQSHGHDVLCVNFDNGKTQYERIYKTITIPFGKPYTDFEFPCFTTHPNTSNKFYSMADAHIKMYETYLQKAFAKIIETFRPDIIHSQYLWVNTSVIADIAEVPVITTSFGNEIHTSREDLRYGDYVKNAVAKTSYIIAPSKQIENELRNEFELDSIKLKLIYRGYNDDIFKFIDGQEDMYRNYFSINEKCKKIVLYHDNLSHIKGIDIFIKAAEKLLANNWDICFIVIGKGEYSKQVRDMVEKHPQYFLYFPEITIEEQPLINHLANLHVMPVRFEKFGIRALESLSMGTPVLSSDIGELSYFINENNGMKIQDMNEHNLADNIEKLLDDNFKSKVSLFCHQYATRNYSKSSGLKLIRKLYEYATEEL